MAAEGATPADIAYAMTLRATSAFSPPENDRGLITAGRLEADWSFDTVEGDTVRDDSQNGIDGRLVNGPELVEGAKGKAVRLNGNDQWVDFGSPLAFRMAGSMSITAWMNPRTHPADDGAIVSAHTGVGYQLDTTRDQGPRTIAFKLANESGRLMARYGKTPLSTDRWYHVAGVYDAKALTLHVYLNGELDDGCVLGEITGRQYVSGASTFVGRRPEPSGFEFAGLIDAVRIYSRAITADEIQTEASASRHVFERSYATNKTGAIAVDSRCPVEPPSDGQISGVAVAVGVLVAIACVGLCPAKGRRAMSVVLSLFAGCALLASLSPLALPLLFRSLVPVLTVAGGASVALSYRDEGSCAQGWPWS
jgi:hypothetical protein